MNNKFGTILKIEGALLMVLAGCMVPSLLIAAAQGQYGDAAAKLKGYNAAVAAVMNNDLSAAKKALAGENSADADYLRAVIATKEGDMKTAGAQLKAAVAKDSALVKKASKDVNLKPLFKSGFKF